MGQHLHEVAQKLEEVSSKLDQLTSMVWVGSSPAAPPPQAAYPPAPRHLSPDQEIQLPTPDRSDSHPSKCKGFLV